MVLNVAVGGPKPRASDDRQLETRGGSTADGTKQSATSVCAQLPVALLTGIQSGWRPELCCTAGSMHVAGAATWRPLPGK